LRLPTKRCSLLDTNFSFALICFSHSTIMHCIHNKMMIIQKSRDIWPGPKYSQVVSGVKRDAHYINPLWYKKFSIYIHNTHIDICTMYIVHMYVVHRSTSMCIYNIVERCRRSCISGIYSLFSSSAFSSKLFAKVLLLASVSSLVGDIKPLGVTRAA